jgi:hypothetical protein
MRNSFFFVLFGIVLEKFSEKKNCRQLQRKVEKFGQTLKIIIFVCNLDHNRR